MTDWKKIYPVGAKVKLTPLGLKLWALGLKTQYKDVVFTVEAYHETSFNGKRFNSIKHLKSKHHFLYVYDNPGTRCFELIDPPSQFDYELADCNLP